MSRHLSLAISPPVPLDCSHMISGVLLAMSAMIIRIVLCTKVVFTMVDIQLEDVARLEEHHATPRRQYAMLVSMDDFDAHRSFSSASYPHLESSLLTCGTGHEAEASNARFYTLHPSILSTSNCQPTVGIQVFSADEVWPARGLSTGFA